MANQQILQLFQIATPRTDGALLGVFVTGSKASEGKTFIEYGGRKYHCVAVTLDGVERTFDRGSPAVAFSITLPQRYGVLDIGRQLMDEVRENALVKRTTVLVEFGEDPPGTRTETLLRNEFYRIGQIRERTNTSVLTEIISERDTWTAIALANRPGRCSWTYRKAGCGYDGPPVADRNDKFTSERLKDECSLTVKGCEFRFPNGSLPFGGVPDVARQQGDLGENL